jgi:hypothetical protein
MGFHHRVGATSFFAALHGETSLLNEIAQFLLEPPHVMADRFIQVLTGSAVELKSDGQKCWRRRRVQFTRRSEIVSAGAMAVSTTGIVRWTVHCSGHSFAIGVIADERWLDFEKDNSFDWPFVGQGAGYGYGLVKRRDSFYISQQCDVDDYWNVNCKDDFQVSAGTSAHTDLFTVVLDLDRARLFFEQDGAKIVGSDIKLINPDMSYRFIASVPENESSVTFVSN